MKPSLKKYDLFKNSQAVAVGLLFVVLSSCEDFVKVDPPETSLIGESVFEDDVNANAAVVGLYANMVDNAGTIFTSNENFHNLTGLVADEFINYSTDADEVQFEQNDLFDDNGNLSFLWGGFYNFIYSCNSIIEGVTSSTGITDSLALQFEGEARFVRAWLYFNLVNLWGDVPLTASSDFRFNSTLSRSPVDQVYAQVITDLETAQELLPEEYPSEERIRPNQAVATTLLARVRLYRQEWAEAEALATNIIDDGRYTIEPDLNDVFNKSSQEAIWQLQSIVPEIATYEGLRFILTRRPFFGGVSFREDFVNAFEVGDDRKSSWVGTVTSGSSILYFPFKYKERRLEVGELPTQYSTVLRLAEVHLIRAEARAHQGNISGAQEDLNLIRTRAGLPNTSASDQTSLLLAVEQERRFELFSEYGQRWLDLVRTNRATAVLGPIKERWDETDRLWPIPQREFLSNPNLGDQNPGY